MLELTALYAVIWVCFHFGSGYVAHRLPAERLIMLPVVSQSYAWEHTGKIYERLRVRSWKDRLPEAGAFYQGGFSKRRLEGSESDYLERFALETIRAESSHWLTWGMALTFFAWNPWQVGMIMVIYGAMSNAPFILVQRYNRARLRRVIRTLTRRANRNRASLPAHTVAHKREIQ